MYNIKITQYNSMGEVCKQIMHNFGNVEIEKTCNQFVQHFSSVTLPYIYEIKANQIKLCYQ